MNFNERLKMWLANSDVKQIDIANKLGVNKSFVSNIVSGRNKPSDKFLDVLEEMSGKSTHWWLFGTDEYDNLHSLNELINVLIDNGLIDDKGNMSDSTRETIIEMLDSEIKEKLEAKNKKT